MNIKDFKWTEKRFGTTFANILRKLGGLSKDSTDDSIEYKDDDGNVTKLVTDSNFNSLLAKNGLIEVTWQELKDKRDNSELIPGSLYRITDYQCTTTQENTQSAAHQFDIVLLALSENKLAEEGWAMMHDNVYDVTFSDGVTKKCYVYLVGDLEWNVVDVETLIGTESISDTNLIINEADKTATIDNTYDNIMTDTNLPYNYFQNSKLEAWKVWYCLDNDKSRFAWAEKDVPTFTCNINVPSAGWSFENVRVIRDYGADYDGRYAYVVINGETATNIATDRELKDSGDYTIYLSVYVSANAHVEILSSSVNGRGVIYRLIDEFNNDIKYDFKNIQFKRKLTDGQYDATNGTDTWCYTLNIWYEAMCQDASIVGNTLPNDEGFVEGVYDNKFGYATSYDFYIEGVKTFAFALGNNVVLSFDDGGYYGIKSNTIGNGFQSNTIGNGFGSNTIGNRFYSNTIGDDFEYNTIGNAFSANIIGNGFYSNIIGNYFSDNTIRGTFSTNTIGNGFDNKTISNNTSGKNYGNNGVELATKS